MLAWESLKNRGIDRYSDTTNNRTLIHREISHADNQLYYGNEDWAHWIWQLKNGVGPSFPTSTRSSLTWESKTFDNQLRIMFSDVDSCSFFEASCGKILHYREATRRCCCKPDICCRSCHGCWWVSLKCWVSRCLDDRTVISCSFSLWTPWATN